ncbi:MAG: AGE family epimerase/isomerase [Aureliella sp.]
MARPSFDPLALQRLQGTYHRGLMADVLPFWLSGALDETHGGYWTCRRADGHVVDTDKCMWQQGRFAWLLSTLANVFPDHLQRDQWLRAAELGIRFIDQYGTDPADGRMWFHVTSSGLPVRKRRYAFSESFASIAYAQWSRATGDAGYGQKAIRAFEAFFEHRTAPKFCSARESVGIGHPMITIATAHELRDALGWQPATQIIAEQIAWIERMFVRDDLQAVLEIVAPDGQVIDHFDGRTLNPGHAIEAAWFIIREGQYSTNPKWIQLGTKMLDWMLQRGWDDQFGGLLYFVSLNDDPIQEYWHDMKFWWPHNEAIIATLMAAHATGDAKYMDWHSRIHSWAYEHFADPEHGEWFGYLRRDGTVSSQLKGNLWKGPFHLPRMQLICKQVLDCMLSDAN